MALQAPINYALDIQSPFKAAADGYTFGQTILADQQKQQDRIAAQQAAQAKAEQDAAFSAEVQAVLANPSAEGYARIGTLDPKNAEAYQKSFATWDKAKKDAALGEGMKVLAALDSGNLPVAQSLMNEKAAAMRNEGKEQDAKAWEDASAASAMNPEEARLRLAAMLYELGGKDFVDTYGNFRKMPSEVKEAEAKATEAGVKANYAESNALLDLEKKGWDITKIQSDIDTNASNARIYAMNAAIARESNALKRQELEVKVQEAVRDRENKIAERAAEAETAANAVVGMRENISELRNSDGFSDLFGASIKPGARFVPGTDAAGAAAILERVKSGAFLLGVEKMRGLGALGVVEGQRLEANLAALYPGMPEDEAVRVLDKVEKTLNKLDELNRKKYGMPENKPAAATGTINTQAEYDALPSGATFVDAADGKQYRKP